MSACLPFPPSPDSTRARSHRNFPGFRSNSSFSHLASLSSALSTRLSLYAVNASSSSSLSIPTAGVTADPLRPDPAVGDAPRLGNSAITWSAFDTLKIPTTRSSSRASVAQRYVPSVRGRACRAFAVTGGGSRACAYLAPMARHLRSAARPARLATTRADDETLPGRTAFFSSLSATLSPSGSRP